MKDTDYEHLEKEQIIRQLQDLRAHIIEELTDLRQSIQSLESTEAKRIEAEQALEFSEARNRAILDTTVEGIISINDSGMIEMFNKAAESIFGYTSAEVMGKNVKVLMPDKYAEHHDEYIQNYISTGKAKIIGIGREVEGKRKDGSVFPMDIAVSEVRLENRRIFTGIVRDITDRKELERQKEEFYAMVTHDIKSPLTAIIGFSELLLLDKKARLDDDYVDMAQSINRNGEKLLRMVEGFLSLSRLENKKLEMAVEAGDIGELVEEVYEDYLPVARNKGISLIWGTDSGMAMVPCDRSYLSRAVENLVQNAIDYTPAGGRVELAAGIAPEGGGTRAYISVADTGKGIPEGETRRVFEKYYCSPKRGSAGSCGLGLAIVKAIAEAHGGSVEVESEMGKGSTFRLLLPLTG